MLNRSAGFTLMELTVVLVIVALLLGGLLIPLSAQRDVDSRRATDKYLADIREALIGFAVINGRLPCPADVSIPSGTTGAGIEAVTATGGPCACSSQTTPGDAMYGSTTACSPGTANTDTVRGVLPWATLGLLETDAWGNRYTYYMSALFGRVSSGQTSFGGSCIPSINPAAAAFALCTQGGITIYTAASGSSGVATLASNVPAVVVSHGKNAYGAYPTTSGTRLSTAGATNDELENTDGDPSFASNSTIDDQLSWVPLTQLMSRMIAAGTLP